MSRQHKPLLLRRGVFSGEVAAVRLAGDGVTITDKYPIANWSEVEQEIHSGAARPAGEPDADFGAPPDPLRWLVDELERRKAEFAEAAADHNVDLMPATIRIDELLDLIRSR